VLAYFGLRTFALGDGPKGKRPLLNGKFVFMAGFLDQSWFPDGQYTAPTDEALAFDIQAIPMFGLNMIRLHQKVNPERWYYYADKLGVVSCRFNICISKVSGSHTGVAHNGWAYL
jgi:beta-galactosidase/beta-glucuronidase